MQPTGPTCWWPLWGHCLSPTAWPPGAHIYVLVGALFAAWGCRRKSWTAPAHPTCVLLACWEALHSGDSGCSWLAHSQAGHHQVKMQAPSIDALAVGCHPGLLGAGPGPGFPWSVNAYAVQANGKQAIAEQEGICLHEAAILRSLKLRPSCSREVRHEGTRARAVAHAALAAEQAGAARAGWSSASRLEQREQQHDRDSEPVD